MAALLANPLAVAIPPPNLSPEQVAQAKRARSLAAMQEVERLSELKKALGKKEAERTDAPIILTNERVEEPKPKKPKRMASEKQKKALVRARAIKAVKKEIRDSIRDPINRVKPTTFKDFGARGPFDGPDAYHNALVRGNPKLELRDSLTSYRDDETYEGFNLRNFWDNRRVIFN